MKIFMDAARAETWPLAVPLAGFEHRKIVGDWIVALMEAVSGEKIPALESSGASIVPTLLAPTSPPSPRATFNVDYPQSPRSTSMLYPPLPALLLSPTSPISPYPSSASSSAHSVVQADEEESGADEGVSPILNIEDGGFLEAIGRMMDDGTGFNQEVFLSTIVFRGEFEEEEGEVALATSASWFPGARW